MIPLRDRVLDLQTRVKLQEEVLVGFCVVQVLDGTGTDVTNVLRQALRSLFHLSENVRLGNGRRTFLENLLEATLRGAIPAVKRDSVTVLITNDLHLQVTRLRTELHHEHRRTRTSALTCSKFARS